MLTVGFINQVFPSRNTDLILFAILQIQQINLIFKRGRKKKYQGLTTNLI